MRGLIGRPVAGNRFSKSPGAGFPLTRFVVCCSANVGRHAAILSSPVWSACVQDLGGDVKKAARPSQRRTGDEVAVFSTGKMEDIMDLRARVIKVLDRGHEVEMEYIASLSDQERSDPGSWERWAVKDSIAHSAAWRAHLADSLAAVSEGREPSRAGDYQHQNELIFNEQHTKSWVETQAMALEAHRSLVAQVSGLTADDLESTSILPWQGDRPLWRVATGTGFNHPLIHISDFYKRTGQVERAAEIVGELATAVADLDDSLDWQGVVQYNLACRHSLLGEKETAIDRLRDALALNPSLIDWSKEDPDLAAIRGEPACQELYESHAHPDA